MKPRQPDKIKVPIPAEMFWKMRGQCSRSPLLVTEEVFVCPFLLWIKKFF